MLDALRADKEKSRRMLADGSYLRDAGGEGTSSQEALYRYFSTRKVALEETSQSALKTATETGESGSGVSRAMKKLLKFLFE